MEFRVYFYPRVACVMLGQSLFDRSVSFQNVYCIVLPCSVGDASNLVKIVWPQLCLIDHRGRWSVKLSNFMLTRFRVVQARG